MRLSTGALGCPVVAIAPDSLPPRIDVRWRALRLTLNEAEAVELASLLVDAVDQLRNQPTKGKHD